MQEWDKERRERDKGIITSPHLYPVVRHFILLHMSHVSSSSQQPVFPLSLCFLTHLFFLILLHPPINYSTSPLLYHYILCFLFHNIPLLQCSFSQSFSFICFLPSSISASFYLTPSFHISISHKPSIHQSISPPSTPTFFYIAMSIHVSQFFSLIAFLHSSPLSSIHLSNPISATINPSILPCLNIFQPSLNQLPKASSLNITIVALLSPSSFSAISTFYPISSLSFSFSQSTSPATHSFIISFLYL